jgi:hypothetical protein
MLAADGRGDGCHRRDSPAMQAALILLVAFTIGLLSWLVAWRYTRHPRQRRQDEFIRARNQALWLEQRLDMARRERWDHAMIVQLSAQLGVACAQLAQARHRARRRLRKRAC